MKKIKTKTNKMKVIYTFIYLSLHLYNMAHNIYIYLVYFLSFFVITFMLSDFIKLKCYLVIGVMVHHLNI